jgi:glycosyltransferase involved in cell wall biosynthesis
MILHNHLSETVYWRSRNPLFRAFDFRSVLAKPLAARQRLIVLELGIKDAIGALAPAFAASIETLEHPILVSERIAEREPAPDERLKIGFVGHASISKGFDRFVEIAGKSASDKEFHAIGIGSADALAMDLKALTRPPSGGPVPRTEYVKALRDVDAVCLPLSNSYDYVASGSVIDAIAGLKPLFCLQNRSVGGIFEKYGPIGYLAETARDLEDFVLQSSMASFLQQRPAWIANLAKARDARSPEALAPLYAASVRRIG